LIVAAFPTIDVSALSCPHLFNIELPGRIWSMKNLRLSYATSGERKKKN